MGKEQKKKKLERKTKEKMMILLESYEIVKTIYGLGDGENERKKSEMDVVVVCVMDVVVVCVMEYGCGGGEHCMSQLVAVYCGKLR